MSDELKAKAAMGLSGKITPPEPVSDYDLKMIHAGLLIPGPKQILSMSREIRAGRGEKFPDLV